MKQIHGGKCIQLYCKTWTNTQLNHPHNERTQSPAPAFCHYSYTRTRNLPSTGVGATGWSEQKTLLQTSQSNEKLSTIQVWMRVSAWAQHHHVQPYEIRLRKKLIIVLFSLILCMCIFCWPWCAHTTRQKGGKIMTHKMLHYWHHCNRNVILHYLWRLFCATELFLLCFFRFFVCSVCVVGHKIMTNNKNRKTHTILYIFSHKNIAKDKNNY